jgi:hypothetical protein
LKKLLAILVLVLLPLQIWAATYYVDPVDGNDSANGTTTGTPWKTLTKVYTFGQTSPYFQPDDQILFKAGTTYSGAGITMTGMGSGTSERPIIMGKYGEGANPIIAPTSATWTALTFENMSYWTIQDLEFQKGGDGSKPVLYIYSNAAPIDHIRILRCTVDGLDESAHTIMTGSSDHHSYPLSNIEIGYCTLHNTVRGSNNNRDGINSWHVSGAWYHHNDIHDFGDVGNGIDLVAGPNNIVEYNIIVGFNGGKVHREDDAELPSSNSTWRYNTVMLTGTDDFSYGFAIEDTDGGYFYNNTVVALTSRNIGAFVLACEYTPAVLTNIKVKNNVLIGGSAGYAYGSIDIPGFTATAFFDGTGNEIDHNYYSNVYGNYLRFSGSVVNDANWSTWLASHTGDLKGLGSVIDGSLQPVSGSVIINAGEDLSLTTDLAGHPIIGLPDMGAYESGFGSQMSGSFSTN